MTYYLKILFITSLLLFTLGCRTLDNAPITHLYVVDTDHHVCSKREITDKKTLASRWVEDMPLEACDGVVGLDAKEFRDLRTYLKDNSK